MSQMVHVVFPCQEGKGPELIGLLKEALVETRAWPGCEAVEVFTDADNPDRVVLWETFAKRSDREAYVSWRTKTGMLDILDPILASEIQTTCLTAHSNI